MRNRYRLSRRSICGGALAGIALLALSGCYPYYYELHYRHADGGRRRRHRGRRRRYRRGHDHRRERRHRRYKHYRERW